MTHATHMSFTMRCTLVFSGGALGGIARVLIMHATDGSIAQFVMPALLLLAINLSGCLLAGIVRSSLERKQEKGRLIEVMDALLITGFCGGYTSYSAFVGFFVEGVSDTPVVAIAIAIATVVLCPCAALLGMHLGGGYRAHGRVATDSV